MICGECWREHYPKQAWIHNPCRYMAGVGGRPEVTVNHVKPEQRGGLSETLKPVRLAETETAEVGETAWGKLGISRATWFRRQKPDAVT